MGSGGCLLRLCLKGEGEKKSIIERMQDTEREKITHDKTSCAASRQCGVQEADFQLPADEKVLRIAQITVHNLLQCPLFDVIMFLLVVTEIPLQDCRHCLSLITCHVTLS